MKLIKITISLILLSCVMFLGAESKGRASVVLEYFDDASQLILKDVDGFQVSNVYIGMQLLAGESIETKNTTVELRMEPNGSIIKISAKTRFKIDSLPTANSKEHAFTLLGGKIRSVAVKSSGTTYRFNTPTASGGVRGTDFGMEVAEGTKDRLIVKDGLVEFTNTATKKQISVGAGQAADTFASIFEPINLSTQELSDFFSTMDFVNLSPDKVNALSEQNASSAVPAEPSSANTNTANASPASVPSNTPVSPQTEPAASPAPSAAPAASGPSLEDEILSNIKKVLGLEIGSITIDGKTYGKLVVQPKIVTDDLKLGFYLPVIYNTDVLNPDDWYRPSGNNEWSFGTDQGDDTLAIIADAAQDVVLKIKYMELFNKGDPFFLKLGSLPSMTLGHGMLVGDYANDSDFPSIRKTGLNLGIDLGGFAWEILTGDVALPEVSATRFLIRPLHPGFKLGVGLSIAADLDPTGDLADTVSTGLFGTAITSDQVKAIDPMIFNVAADLDLPIFEADGFSLLLYADAGGLIPYLNAPLSRSDGSEVQAGMYFQNVFSLDSNSLIELHNYGIMAGLMGKILIVDYRLEFQSFNGSFQANYFDSTYDRNRAQKAVEVLSVIKDASGSVYDVQKMGIYGKAGVDLFNLVKVSAAYKWPWTAGSSSSWDLINQINPDEFEVSVDLNEELIPYNIDGSFKFHRSHFRDLFEGNSTYTFLDTYATFTGSVDVPIGTFFKIRATLGTSILRDSNGNIDYSEGLPQVRPSFTLETVF